MSEPIKVGDLVMIVRADNPSPIAQGLVGMVQTVVSIGRPNAWCGNYELTGYPGGIWCQKHHIKRIPPLSDLEGEKREEKLNALV